MKEREYIITLFETYKDLLTKKQQQYFKDYYYEDLSLSEISENYKVSKSLIGKTINTTENKLKKFETILEIVSKNKQLNTIIKDLKDNNLKTKIDKIING